MPFNKLFKMYTVEYRRDYTRESYIVGCYTSKQKAVAAAKALRKDVDEQFRIIMWHSANWGLDKEYAEFHEQTWSKGVNYYKAGTTIPHDWVEEDISNGPAKPFTTLFGWMDVIK